jgi:hypothetical protein
MVETCNCTSNHIDQQDAQLCVSCACKRRAIARLYINTHTSLSNIALNIPECVAPMHYCPDRIK